MKSDTPAETRERILAAATELFAEKGFAETSTREIAKRAKANIASLHYHFGDKAELYRTVFGQFALHAQASPPAIDWDKAPFFELYQELNRQLFVHLADSHLPRLAARERLEPSGVLGDAWMAEVRQRHALLDRALARELGLSTPDADVQRLTFALVGMAVFFDHGRPMMEIVAPELTRSEDWVEATLSRLSTYAKGMLAAERQRRRTASGKARGKSVSS